MSKIPSVLRKKKVERRNDDRFNINIPVHLVYKGRLLHARYVDVSQRGLAIRILDDISLEVGSDVFFTLGNYKILSKVIWVDTRDGSVVAGIRITGRKWLSAAGDQSNFGGNA